MYCIWRSVIRPYGRTARLCHILSVVVQIWGSNSIYCLCPHNIPNKAIRDGRPRPPRHQVGWDIPLHFDTNPESLRPFVPEIWPNNVFNLSATYDLDRWPKILKIFVSHSVPIRNMYAKFHNDRFRNGWDITHWNFAKTRTNKQTNKHTDRQTDMGITIPRPPPMGGEVIMPRPTITKVTCYKSNIVCSVPALCMTFTVKSTGNRPDGICRAQPPWTTGDGRFHIEIDHWLLIYWLSGSIWAVVLD